MPGQFQLPLDELEKEVASDSDEDNCLMTDMLYGIPARKDEQATGAWHENGIVEQAARR